MELKVKIVSREGARAHKELVAVPSQKDGYFVVQLSQRYGTRAFSELKVSSNRAIIDRFEAGDTEFINEYKQSHFEENPKWPGQIPLRGGIKVTTPAYGSPNTVSHIVSRAIEVVPY